MQRYDKFRLPPNFSGKKLHFYVIFSHFLTKHTKNSGLRCFFLDKGEDKGEYQRESLHNPTCRAGNWESALYIIKVYARMADRPAVMPRSRGRNPGVPSDDRVPNATSRQRLLCEIIHALTLPHAHRRQPQVGSPHGGRRHFGCLLCYAYLHSPTGRGNQLTRHCTHIANPNATFRPRKRHD